VVVVAVGKRASRQRGSSAIGGGSKGSKDGKKGKRRVKEGRLWCGFLKNSRTLRIQ